MMRRGVKRTRRPVPPSSPGLPGAAHSRQAVPVRCSVSPLVKATKSTLAAGSAAMLLRALAAYSTGDKRPIAAHADAERALAVLNRASALAPSWPELEWDSKLGPRSRTRCDNTTAMAVLSRIAGQAIGLFSAPGRAELRACYGPGCVLYFVRDHPRREWCSPVCGNRARVARHYARHRRNTTT